MTSARSDDSINQVIGLESATLSVSPASVGDELTFAETVHRLVDQCSSLLHHQLERKIKIQPHIYDRAKLHRVMADFDSVSRDIKATVSTRVRSRVVELIQDEVRRIFEDAMSDLDAALRSDTVLPVEQETRQSDSSTNDDTQLLTGEAAKPSHEIETRPISSAPQSRPPVVKEDPNEPVAAMETSGPPSQTPEAPESTREVLMEPIESAEQLPGVEQARLGKGTEQSDGERIYEGKVRLLVEVGDNGRQLVSFVEELRRKSELRLLQLVGNRNETAEVWLWLRMPLRLRDILTGFGAVAQVMPGDGPIGDELGPVLSVRLRDVASVN